MLGLENEKAKGRADRVPAIRRIFEKEPIPQVTRALLGCALIAATSVRPYSFPGNAFPELQALAKRYKA